MGVKGLKGAFSSWALPEDHYPSNDGLVTIRMSNLETQELTMAKEANGSDPRRDISLASRGGG